MSKIILCRFGKSESILLLVVCMALFVIPLTITSSSIFNLSIMRKFNINYYQAQLFITLLMVFYASFLTITGSLADIYGRKKILTIGLLIFLIGFLIGGLTDHYVCLLISRAICGVGAAAVTTSGTALLTANIARKKQEKAFSIFGSTLGISMVCGPLIAGFSSSYTNGWRVFSLSIFIFLLVTLCLSCITKDNNDRHSASVDWIGGCVLIFALLFIVFAFSFMPIWGFLDVKSLFCLAIGISCLIIFIFIERRVANPIMNIDSLKNKNLSAMCITTLLLGFGCISLLFYLPYYLKDNLLLSDTSISWVATIATIPSLILPIIISKFKAHFSNKKLLLATFLCLSLGPVILCVVITSHHVLNYVIPLLIFGSSFGISLSFIDGEAVSSINITQSGTASGIFNTFRIGGEAISIPLISAFVSLLNSYSRTCTDKMFYFLHPINMALIIISVICSLFSFYVIKMIFKKNNQGSNDE